MFRWWCMEYIPGLLLAFEGRLMGGHIYQDKLTTSRQYQRLFWNRESLQASSAINKKNGAKIFVCVLSGYAKNMLISDFAQTLHHH